ncbi:hypothetical protein N9917_04655 [Deltaproteobacteria bacterium]|nr:hypothetical protein [Deltaproteobacteria bacterium]
MAAIGTTPSANRYESLVVGPRLGVSYETQTGVPIDGSSQLLRDLSPFQIRLLPPDALVAAADASVGAFVDATGDANAATLDVNLLSTALEQADTTALSTALAQTLARSTAIQVSSSGQFEGTADLESLLANGKFLQGQGDVNFPTISDATTAADIALQVQAVLSAPPLTLLINPKEMSINYTKLQNYGTRTRFGYIFEGWGEEQPTMTFSGSTGAFISGIAASANQSNLTGQSGQNSGVSGVQFAAKRDSAAFQNLMALYTFYRNNGYIYDTVGQSEAHQFIGSIAIDYDQWTYVGHFESFDYSYSEEMQNRIEWNIEFKVSRMYDWASSPSVVLPQTSPTQSPSNSGRQKGTRTPSAVTVGQAIIGRDNVADATSDEGQVPLGLLGGF